MSGLLTELKHRNVIRTAGLYLVGAWLATQVAGTVLPMFGAPEWLPRSIVIVLAIGFIPALVFAWVFELTPEGLKRDAEVKPEESIAPQTAQRMDRMIIVVMALALAYFAFDKFVLSPRREAAALAAAKGNADSQVAVVADRKSVAVLPFENLSRDPDNAYFVEGIQDEILTRLAGVSALKVISRTSTMRYASRPENLKEIGRQLGVANLIEGSVQRAGGTARVNVQLIVAESDSHLWAETFDRDVQNVFAIETEVAQKVAEALRAKLLPAESARIASVPTTNPAAYDQFLKAEYFVNQIDASTAKDPGAAAHQAQTLYESAIAADPAFALAHAQLAYLRISMYWRGIEASAQMLEAARDSANRALALQPNLPEAHLALGFVHYWGHRDYTAALSEFATARVGLPNDANVAKAIGFVYRRQGQVAKSVPEFERAAVLDPRDARAQSELGMTLGLLRRYDEAVAAFNRALALAPDAVEARLFLAVALLSDAKLARAQAALAVIPADVDPQGLVSRIRFNVAMAARQPDAALTVLANAPDWFSDGVDNMQIPTALLKAQALDAKGEAEPARAAYEQARLALEAELPTAREPAGIESYLAIAYAGLGRKSAALAAGRRAIELLPVSQDVAGGAAYLQQLAQVEARVGETQSAIDHLGQLLALPAGFSASAALLRNDPDWDPLRKEPRFDRLIEQAEAAMSRPPQTEAKP
jgi:TolB-like protein